ncbi:hypothetical protein IE81DRAFT_107003 [Ceraceosorus guamensis]|uniref:Uncharacterized protein n=1 Tax=Ceraceosorus guamensis TaxID=1522189 RepID=A0A316W0A2_9BASI|nr:hypothetical protein IE81DRAFT_107003 [Ceraceosorus guamensis]PWN42954.1 hypothetical protein IE81DRAFT_107003 [Ceraceosorus guamensis]
MDDFLLLRLGSQRRVEGEVVLTSSYASPFLHGACAPRIIQVSGLQAARLLAYSFAAYPRLWTLPCTLLSRFKPPYISLEPGSRGVKLTAADGPKMDVLLDGKMNVCSMIYCTSECVIENGESVELTEWLESGASVTNATNYMRCDD